jgi:glycosyltransferase involved in cell wall biosynthesis
LKKKVNKILAISTHTYPTQGFGGPSISFRVIIDFLNSKNVSSTLLSTTPYNPYVINNNGNSEYFFKSYFFHKLGFAPLLFLKFLILLRSHNGFIINGLTTFPNFCGLLVAYIFKKKVLITPRGGLEFGRTDDWSIIKKMFFKIQILILESLNNSGQLYLVYATESEMYKCLFNKIKNKSVFPNILPSYFEIAAKLKQDKDIDLLYVGRYSKEKGIDRLLDLLSKHEVLVDKVIYLVFSGLESNQYKSICKIVEGLDCTILINVE